MWGNFWPIFLVYSTFFRKLPSQIWDFCFKIKESLWGAPLYKQLHPDFFTQKVLTLRNVNFTIFDRFLKLFSKNALPNLRFWFQCVERVVGSSAAEMVTPKFIGCLFKGLYEHLAKGASSRAAEQGCQLEQQYPVQFQTSRHCRV